MKGNDSRNQNSLPCETSYVSKGEQPSQSLAYSINQENGGHTARSERSCCRASCIQTSWGVATVFLIPNYVSKGGDESQEWQAEAELKGCEWGGIKRLWGATLSHGHPSQGALRKRCHPSLGWLGANVYRLPYLRLMNGPGHASLIDRGEEL